MPFDYQRYLASREWALRKEQVRERSGGICERCRRAPHTQTHHLTYERIGQERIEDLLGVCPPCHEFLSGKRHDDPAAEPFTIQQLDHRHPDLTECLLCGGSPEWVLIFRRLRLAVCIPCGDEIYEFYVKNSHARPDKWEAVQRRLAARRSTTA